MRDECSHGSLRSKCLVCEVTAERDSAYAALDSVSGALMDSGTIPVPEDEGGYGDAVRALTGERDALSERVGALEGALGNISREAEDDPEQPFHDRLTFQIIRSMAQNALLRPAEGEEGLPFVAPSRMYGCVMCGQSSSHPMKIPHLISCDRHPEKFVIETPDPYAAEMGPDACGTFKDIPDAPCWCMAHTEGGKRLKGFRVHLKDGCYLTIEAWKLAKAERTPPPAPKETGKEGGSGCNPPHTPDMACDSCVDRRGGTPPWTEADEEALATRSAHADDLATVLCARLGIKRQEDKRGVASSIEIAMAQDYERAMKRGRKPSERPAPSYTPPPPSYTPPDAGGTDARHAPPEGGRGNE